MQLVQVLTNLSTIICTCTIYIFILSTSIYTNTRSKIWGGGEWGGAGQWCSTIAQLPHYTQHWRLYKQIFTIYRVSYMAVCTDERDVYVRCVNDVAVSQTCVGVCVWMSV